MTTKKMPTDAVLSWIEDCINEAEASGYEVAESAATTGEPLVWCDKDGHTPAIEYVAGRTMIVRMPDGSKVNVTARRIRSK